MPPRAVSNLSAGEHPRNLLHASSSIQNLNVYFRTLAGGLFLYQQVTVSEACNLRLMSYAKDLVGFRQPFEFHANCLAHPPAYSGIYFVEHDRARKLRRVGHGL